MAPQLQKQTRPGKSCPLFSKRLLRLSSFTLQSLPRPLNLGSIVRSQLYADSFNRVPMKIRILCPEKWLFRTRPPPVKVVLGNPLVACLILLGDNYCTFFASWIAGIQQ